MVTLQLCGTTVLPTMIRTRQILLLILTLKCSQTLAKILLIEEKDELHLAELFKESNQGQYNEYIVDHDQEDDFKQNSSFCEQLQLSGSIAAVVDLSWGGWFAAKQISLEKNIPYFRVEVSNAPFVQAADNFLSQRDALDAALIFQNDVELDQSLYFIIENYDLRILVMSLDDKERDVYERLKNVRPLPTAFVAFGTAENLSKLVKKASSKKLIQRHSRWNLFVEDFASPDLNMAAADVDVVLGSIRPEDCCGLLASSNSCNCEAGIKPKQMVAKMAGKIVAKALSNVPNYSHRCTGTNVNNVEQVLNKVQQEAESVNYVLEGTKLHYPFQLDIKQTKGKTDLPIGQWTPKTKMVFQADFKNIVLPKLFRIGMTPSKPWMNFKLDSKGQRMKDTHGDYIYEGYCIEFLDKLAEKVGFEYEIILSPDYQKSGFEYGRKNPDGSWSGLIGDLYASKTDIIVADLTMTSEREEDIDYVSPYFDQAGMSIVQRKKYKEQSIFKFLYVLKPEVWLGILGAVIATALLIWFLDRFSPYSGRNNKAAYSGESCRVFTLKESFWFALTSLTPQGGGEPPKALSGRVLAAAYWLFVVLMLATFTANLAAFLTVERMQTDLQGLEELAKQSRINYTVVRDTVYYDYFANMAGAEEMLYQKWKELSLNASEDAAKFRVWDYPIKEQWTQIYHAIQETGPVNSAYDGFKKVRESLKGEFALIHDAAQIKYEVYNDCDLVEIGEPFSEQPYSLAVQQGSYLAEELSRTILQLQKERFFEVLQSKYWNTSKRHNCPVLDDTEGITLKSLGGVFIATLVGLVIAMITLVFEVYMQRKKERNEVQNVSDVSTVNPKAVANISTLFHSSTKGGGEMGGGMPGIHS